ncbi:hypothetical protein JXD20_03375 [Candidatus Peregrinibacteria bacterium]|nr:hypothetical protein [Candidatus Peregrinibacteria bacterium]
MSKELFSPRNNHENAQSGTYRIKRDRVQFHELFSTHSKEAVFNSGYSLQGNEITDAETRIRGLGRENNERERRTSEIVPTRNRREERDTIPDIMQARRRILKRFRGAA